MSKIFYGPGEFKNSIVGMIASVIFFLSMVIDFLFLEESTKYNKLVSIIYAVSIVVVVFDSVIISVKTRKSRKK